MPLPQPPGAPTPFSVSMNLTTLGTSYQRGHVVLVLSCLAPFMPHNVLTAPPHWGATSFNLCSTSRSAACLCHGRWLNHSSGRASPRSGPWPVWFLVAAPSRLAGTSLPAAASRGLSLVRAQEETRQRLRRRQTDAHTQRSPFLFSQGYQSHQSPTHPVTSGAQNPSPYTVTLGVGTSTYEFGGPNSAHNRCEVGDGTYMGWSP